MRKCFFWKYLIFSPITHINSHCNLNCLYSPGKIGLERKQKLFWNHIGMENNLGTWPNLNCVNISYKNHPSLLTSNKPLFSKIQSHVIFMNIAFKTRRGSRVFPSHFWKLSTPGALLFYAIFSCGTAQWTLVTADHWTLHISHVLHCATLHTVHMSLHNTAHLTLSNTGHWTHVTAQHCTLVTTQHTLHHACQCTAAPHTAL